MTRTKLIAWSLAGVSAASLLVSSYTLFRRIDTYNREHPRTMYYFQPISATSFIYAGEDVAITEDRPPDGPGELTVAFGDELLTIPVAIPPVVDAMTLESFGLEAHRDWMHVLRMIEGEPGKTFDEVFAEVEAAERTDRLIIVTRTPKPEENEGLLEEQGLIETDFEGDWGYGEVQRKNWFFDFYEFLPDGTFERHETLRFPSTKYMDTPIEGELKQGTWQYSASLYVMPTGSAPKHNFTEAALVHAGKSLAWAGVSVLVLMGSIAFAIAPSRADRAPGGPASTDVPTSSDI